MHRRGKASVLLRQHDRPHGSRDAQGHLVGLRRPLRYANRQDAGRELATHLETYAGCDDVVVLGLPRGGLPVAAEVAVALGAPLDVFVVRKLGVPGQRELAMGAIATGGVTVLNDEVVKAVRITDDVLAAVVAAEREELERREANYREGRPPLDVRGRAAILVDDGLATGATMRAAARALRELAPKEVVVAVPVGAPQTCARVASDEAVDALVCPLMPAGFFAVGEWYRDFTQTTDAEVRALLLAH